MDYAGKNDQGFEVRRGDKVLVTTSVSALSGKKVGAGAVTVPVPNMQGVFYKVAPGEALGMNEHELAEIVVKAARLFAEPKPQPRAKKKEEK